MRQNAPVLEINSDQLALIDALMTCGNHSEAAKKVGISRATAQRWLREEAFQAALAEAQRRVAAETIQKLLSEQSRSVDVIVSLRDSSTPKDAVRLRAALAIVELGLKLRETLELETRLDALEAALEARA